MLADSAVRTLDRAIITAGESVDPVYRMVAAEIADLKAGAGKVIDVGCGTGRLWPMIKDQFDQYLGVDVVRYPELAANLDFIQLDLDNGRVPVNDGDGDCVVSVETIEHVENPRALFRELVRLAKPGGRVIVTTPNQMSLVSKLSLLTRGHFDAFIERPGNYPSHITALLEVDLIRIATECGLADLHVRFSNDGRIPVFACRWPKFFVGRRFSENILISGRKPENS